MGRIICTGHTELGAGVGRAATQGSACPVAGLPGKRAHWGTLDTRADWSIEVTGDAPVICDDDRSPAVLPRSPRVQVTSRERNFKKCFLFRRVLGFRASESGETGRAAGQESAGHGRHSVGRVWGPGFHHRRGDALRGGEWWRGVPRGDGAPGLAPLPSTAGVPPPHTGPSVAPA